MGEVRVEMKVVEEILELAQEDKTQVSQTQIEVEMEETNQVQVKEDIDDKLILSLTPKIILNACTPVRTLHLEILILVSKRRCSNQTIRF